MSLVRSRTVRAAVAVPALLLTCLVGVAAPLLERADVRANPVIESEHDPGSCPAPHDHRLCTQASANHAAPSEGSDGTAFAASLGTLPITTASAIVTPAARTSPPARAPPSS